MNAVAEWVLDLLPAATEHHNASLDPAPPRRRIALRAARDGNPRDQ